MGAQIVITIEYYMIKKSSNQIDRIIKLKLKHIKFTCFAKRRYLMRNNSIN